MRNGDFFQKNQVLAFLRSSAVFLYDLLLKPKSTDEDLRRQEFILNLILLGLLALIAWSNIVILISEIKNQSAANHLPLIPFTLLCLFFLGLYIASRRGYVRVVSYCLVIILLSVTIYGTSQWGASLPAGILSYALIITMSAILINRNAGLIAATLSVAVLAFHGWQEISSGTMPTWKQGLITPFDIIEYALLFGVIAIVSWLSSTEIEKSLRRARKSEGLLRLERDSLEIKVEERTAEIKQLQAEKMSQLYRFAEFGRLSSGLFHDLASPLSALTLNIGAIHDSVHPDVQVVKEDLARAIKASDRMAALINAIKKQVSTNSAPETFSINETIAEVISLFSYKSLALKVELRFSAAETIMISGRQVKLYQALTNLISNAFDSYESYEDANSTRRVIDISLTPQEQFTIITVTDYGEGISEDIMPQIFDPFFSTKASTRGMGLGLSTVRQVISEEFGGSVTAESNPSLKTVFTIRIPLPEA